MSIPLTRTEIEAAKARAVDCFRIEELDDIAENDVPALADTALYWQDRCERATELLQALKGRIFMNCKEVQQADAFLAEAQPEQKEAEG